MTILQLLSIAVVSIAFVFALVAIGAAIVAVCSEFCDQPDDDESCSYTNTTNNKG